MIRRLFKRLLYKISQYFSSYEHSARNMNFKLNLSYYATKANLKGAAGVGTFNLAVKSDLARSKVEVDKIDIGKLKTIPVDVVKKLYMINCKG